MKGKLIGLIIGTMVAVAPVANTLSQTVVAAETGNAVNTSQNNKTSLTASNNFTGVKKSGARWVFYRNGKADYTYTGVAHSTGGNWVFVKKGLFDASYSGVAKSTSGNWVYVKNGRYYTKYTGVARSTSGNWVYVKNGRYYTKYTGVARSTSGNWVYVINGRFSPQARKASGVTRSSSGNYVYIKNGRFDSSYTGLAKSLLSGDLVYVKKGRYYTGFSGTAVYNGKTYTVKKGRAVNQSVSSSHEHEWVPVYKTLHHEAVTHEEEVEEPYTYTTYESGYEIYVVASTNPNFKPRDVLLFSTDEDYVRSHVYTYVWTGGVDTYDCSFAYRTAQRPVEATGYETVTKTIIDKEAWDEQVIDHYECSCGEIKEAE